MITYFLKKIKILRGLVRAYQWTISPLLGNCCRFYPSCSNYALEALKQHALPKAIFLIVKRLIKCFPWHPGGHDPVPPKE